MVLVSLEETKAVVVLTGQFLSGLREKNRSGRVFFFAARAHEEEDWQTLFEEQIIEMRCTREARIVVHNSVFSTTTGANSSHTRACVHPTSYRVSSLFDN